MANTMNTEATRGDPTNTPEAPGLTQPKQETNQENQSQSVKNAAAVREAAKRQSESQGQSAGQSLEKPKR